VLAEKDLLAVELLEKYNSLPMPGMRLDANPVDSINAESNWINHAQHHQRPMRTSTGKAKRIITG
jgi:hypothetical protein